MATGKKIPKVEAQAEPASIPAPAWYQYQNWWEGKDREFVILYLKDHKKDKDDWAVVPGWLIEDLFRLDTENAELRDYITSTESVAAHESNRRIERLASEIFMELIRTTKNTAETFADRAWTAAESFYRRGVEGPKELSTRHEHKVAITENGE